MKKQLQCYHIRNYA